MKKYDALIFDLDGTLWDATNGITYAWNQIFQQNNISLQLSLSDIQNVMGYTVKEIAQKFFPKDSIIGEEIITKCCRLQLSYLNKENVFLYPQLKQTIKILSQKYKLCIVSNCLKGYIEKFLEIANLKDYFVDFENAENTKLTKKDNILLVKQRNHFKNVIYIGDTIKDYQAAKGANVDFIQALYGFDQAIKNVDGIKNINELTYYFK